MKFTIRKTASCPVGNSFIFMRVHISESKHLILDIWDTMGDYTPAKILPGAVGDIAGAAYGFPKEGEI